MAYIPLAPMRALLVSSAVLAVAGCSDFDIDLRNTGTGIDTSDAARTATAPRPSPDANGVISYPTYQVVVARPGDTVASVAARIGAPAGDLARFNGIDPNTQLRPGEIIAIPGRVVPADAATAPETVDISTLAGGAIQRADAQNAPATAPAPADGTEPVRHRVERGETAYSIARLYNVSVRSLADWNGLGSDLDVREGQYLLIPVAVPETKPARQAITKPGVGSPTPTPPSGANPLPKEEAIAAKPLPSPDLGAQKTTEARLAYPVNGDIIRPYEKNKNEGIDIAAQPGATVIAAEGGTVAAITRDTDQVPILVIRHADNLLTVYANIDKIVVNKGDKVARGQKIAGVRAGTPSFLHFEVRQGFESVDPVPYLK